MNTRMVMSLSLSALVLGGTMVGCTAGGGDIATASSRSEARAMREAAASADKAAKLLAKGDHARAVTLAEAAVALRPRDADYRVLLGQSYIKAGRFASADRAFSDTLVLAPANGRAALNLALSQIAEGRWDVARATLDAHAATIPAADRGLALALAGDPNGGVAVLTDATRSTVADMKTRQNLALAMALAGRWQEARTIVAVDLPADQVDHRILEWAAFAQPASASDQVAALLGVVPVKDPGQPVALALNAPSSVGVAAADVDAFLPGRAPEAVEAAALIPTPTVAPAPVPASAIVSPTVASVATIAAARGDFKARLSSAVRPTTAAPRPFGKGDWYVQLGAFDNAAVARDAWGRAQRRYSTFKAQTPSGMPIAAKGANFYRLSIGGFARADAMSICRQYRARGGACFVRAGAGDRVAVWIKPNAKVQFASR